MNVKDLREGLYKIIRQRRGKKKPTPVGKQKQQLTILRTLAVHADEIARNYGKRADIKTPIAIHGLSLVIRNRDENSRDELVSVNTIQTAMDIATAAAAQGMNTICHKAQGALQLTISPKDKEQK